jgi:hypothetical protein
MKKDKKQYLILFLINFLLMLSFIMSIVLMGSVIKFSFSYRFFDVLASIIAVYFIYMSSEMIRK